MVMRLSITVLNIIWITENNRYWKIHKHMKHPLLDDLQACSETSKLGWYEVSTFRRLTSMLRITQIWIVQCIQILMMNKHNQNLPR